MVKSKDSRILIIEDNPGDQLLLEENLRQTDLLINEIIVAETLSEGISKLRNGDFSLIFLDLFLPDSRGLDSFHELIKIKPSVPVIIYSGLSDAKMALNALVSGAQDFLIKGDYSIPVLEKTVRYSIERKRSQDALQESIEQYNLISRATHDMVWDWDLVTGEVSRNNEGWKKIFKTPKNKDAGSRDEWMTKVHPDDREPCSLIIDKLLASDTQEFFEMEFRILRDDNSIGYLHDRGFISRDVNGKPIRLIGASQDITARKEAEQKVLLSEQRFKSLVQNSADLLCILDTQGNYTYVSPTSKNLLGFDPEFFIGKSAFSFMHDDDKEKMLTYFSLMATEPFAVVPLFRFKNSSDEWRWIESSITNLLHDPSVNGIVVNSRDVTESKIAADEIEKLSLVAKNTSNAVFILNPDRKVEWVNDAFTRITEFRADEVAGKRPSEFLYGNKPDHVLFAEIRNATTKGYRYDGERFNFTKSGRPIWTRLQLQPLFNEEGKIKQYFGILIDITEKKYAEDELKKLSMVAKETINGVVISDKDRNVVWVNDAFTRLSGYSLDEVIGKNHMHLLQGPRTDRETIEYVDEKITGKESFVFEILHYTKSKQTLYVRVQVQPIFDDEGNVKQYFALQTDITKEKELERIAEHVKLVKQKEITDAVFAAQENERSEIGRELHDNVNQLLVASRLYIDMAKGEKADRDSLLCSASAYTLDAIEEIRKLSKTLITPMMSEMGLVDSVKQLAEEIMFVYPIKINVHTAHFNEAGMADKFKLNMFRIVQEQITNTLKHAKAKEINIRLEEIDELLKISVSDNGIGFDTREKKKGVGIQNIKSRSELYNGVVQLNSVLGNGTELCVSFNIKEIFTDNGEYSEATM